MTPAPTQPRIANCSFCGKPDTAIAKLVAGPGVFICDECVSLATQVIEGSTAAPAAEDAPPPLAPWEYDMPLDTVLGSITKIGATGAQTDRNLRLFVAKARDLGATWTQVGAALGIARQSAWERFSGEE